MTTAKYISPRITSGTTLGQVCQLVYNRCIRDYPCLGIVTGNIRTGKSRSILLNINDYWYKQFFNQIPDKRSINTDVQLYVTSLKNAEPYKLINLDESIDAIGKGKSNTSILKDLNDYWAICGERKVPSLIVMDDIFELTPKIARRFVTFWIHVERRKDNRCLKCNTNFVGFACTKCGSKHYKEGAVIYRFYSKKRLIDILTVNESRLLKRIEGSGVAPNFRSILNEYKGELLTYYTKLKVDKTDKKMMEVEKKHGINSHIISAEDKQLNRQIIDMKYNKGMTIQDIAEELNMDYWKVSSKLKKLTEVMDSA
jgi:hypothetical protein